MLATLQLVVVIVRPDSCTRNRTSGASSIASTMTGPDKFKFELTYWKRFLLHKTLNLCWFNARPAFQLNKSMEQDAKRHDDGYIDHKHLEERTYCESQVI